MNSLRLSDNQSVVTSDHADWAYNDLLVTVDQAHRLHMIYATLSHAVQEVNLAKIKCSRPATGTPQPPDIINAPIAVHTDFCGKVAEHLKAAVPVSHQALVLYEEVSFWQQTCQTITAQDIESWKDTLNDTERSLRSQARGTLELIHSNNQVYIQAWNNFIVTITRGNQSTWMNN